MEIPSNVELYETTISTSWFNEDGFLCTVSKNVERKIEYYEEVIRLYKFLIDTRGLDKLLLISDASNSVKLNREVREYIVHEMHKYVKAHAVISRKPLEVTLSNVFIGLSWYGFPVRMFTGEKEAANWLKEYM